RSRSGLVLEPLIPAIIRDLVALSTMSTTSYLVSDRPAGIWLALKFRESIVAQTFGIVDLFAGPGGLGEGFASYREASRSPFHIGVLVEKEASAHRTLSLRA